MAEVVGTSPHNIILVSFSFALLVHDLLSATFPHVHSVRIASNCSINATGVPEIGSYPCATTSTVQDMYMQAEPFVDAVGVFL